MRGKKLLSYFSAQTINYGDSKEPSRCCFGALEYSKHILKWMDKRIFSYIFYSRRVVVSYKRKCVHKLLVNRLLKPAQEKVWLSELTVPQ